MNQIEALYRQYASAVFRFAWGRCGDRSVAEDIVSETYVRLLTRAPEVVAQTALAYLLAIARTTWQYNQYANMITRWTAGLPEAQLRAVWLNAPLPAGSTAGCRNSKPARKALKSVVVP